MSNARGKSVDSTYLSIDQAEARGFLHRDYIAHCLRWTHVVKYIGRGGHYKRARVLDVGCGKEMPLAKLLHSSRMGTAHYAACDVATLTTPTQFANASWKPHKIFSEMDVCDLEPSDFEAPPTEIVCFEVAEHVEPDHFRRMLAKFHELLSHDGRVFISTPCYDENVGHADNHVNEMTYHAFGAALEDSGFRIEGHWGTFASMKDYKHELTPAQREVWEQLREYYDTNYLSTILAPLIPEFSRNCIWQLHKDDTKPRLFQALADIPGRWGSSEHWKRLLP